METHRPSKTKGLYVSEYVDLERFDDLFISAGSEKMKANKLCDWRPGGSSLYCRRTDGTKKQSQSINKFQSFKQELFFGYHVCLSKEKSTIEIENINSSSSYKHYLHHKMNSISKKNFLTWQIL